MVGLASKLGRKVVVRAGEVEAYTEGGAVYVEAPIGANRVDLLDVITQVEAQYYHAQDQNQDEETDRGCRIKFLKALAQKGIGLFSTPMLVGLGALAATAEIWIQLPQVVVG